MKTVLIIEDDQIILEMYRDKFEVSNFGVITALNGKDGLAAAFAHHPDLVLLDLAMPKMDGMSVMQKLREDLWGAKVPVIILTNLNLDGKMLEEIITHKPTYSLMKTNTTPEEVLEKAKEILEKGGDKK
jgi:DNA-binding response OmpR family regulator